MSDRLKLAREIAAALVLIAPPALADELPVYEPEVWCNKVARAGGSYSAVLAASCLEQEQAAYDALKSTWVNVPNEARKWCDQVAKAGGHGSFALLQSCIEQETEARESMPKFQR
jgi:hypothetical protein